jgi:hypothetical protein
MEQQYYKKSCKIWITLDAKDMNHHRAVMIPYTLRWAISHGRTELTSVRIVGCYVCAFTCHPKHQARRYRQACADSESDLQLAALATAGREEPAVVPSTPSSELSVSA